MGDISANNGNELAIRLQYIEREHDRDRNEFRTAITTLTKAVNTLITETNETKHQRQLIADLNTKLQSYHDEFHTYCEHSHHNEVVALNAQIETLKAQRLSLVKDIARIVLISGALLAGYHFGLKLL